MWSRLKPVFGACVVPFASQASAPTFAAIVGLLNDHIIAGGGKPMGFLNPFIYKNAQAFTDVTIGSNKIGRGGLCTALPSFLS
jgi:tripeptidyl-peptidase-1